MCQCISSAHKVKYDHRPNTCTSMGVIIRKNSGAQLLHKRYLGEFKSVDVYVCNNQLKNNKNKQDYRFSQVAFANLVIISVVYVELILLKLSLFHYG